MWVDESDFFLRLFTSALAILFFVVAITCAIALKDFRAAAAAGAVAAGNLAGALAAHSRLKRKRAEEASRPPEKPIARDWMGNPLDRR
jgi:hypothetical protein